MRCSVSAVCPPLQLSSSSGTAALRLWTVRRWRKGPAASSLTAWGSARLCRWVTRGHAPVAGSTGARSGLGHVGSQAQLGHAPVGVTWGRRVNWGTLRSGSRGVAGSTGARSGRGHVGSHGQLEHAPVGVTWGRILFRRCPVLQNHCCLASGWVDALCHDSAFGE